MYAPKTITGFLLGVFVLVQIADCKHRLIRSPDTMEVVFPDYSVDREQNDQELQDKVNQEEEYWQGEGQTNEGKLEDRYENAEEHRENDQEKYEEEKDYQHQQREGYEEDMNERYDSNKEDFETHHNTNQEHYSNQDDLSAYQEKGESGNQEFQNEAAEKGGHFEQQGENFVTERGDVDNFEALVVLTFSLSKSGSVSISSSDGKTKDVDRETYNMTSSMDPLASSMLKIGDELEQAIIKCNETFRIEISYLEALNESGSFPDETDRTPKCFVRCVLENTGVASEEGKYDPARTAEVFAGERGGKPMDDIQEIAAGCADRREMCKCERAYNYMKCIMETEIRKYE